MKSKLTQLPFSSDDILILRGPPVAKKVKSVNQSFVREEWVYYRLNNNTQESYLFQNGQLVGWTKNAFKQGMIE